MKRLELASRAADLRSTGRTQQAVADELGISRSYASELLDDPEGAKARARKKSYQGECELCGHPTTGCFGRAGAPKRCASCSHALQRAAKVWTRSAVIDAIQRFAAEHGRPPTADEWITADPVNGYPPRSAVYQHNSRKNQPFRRWADAIEAAGFPRPTCARRLHSEQLDPASRP